MALMYVTAAVLSVRILMCFRSMAEYSVLKAKCIGNSPSTFLWYLFSWVFHFPLVITLSTLRPSYFLHDYIPLLFLFRAQNHFLCESSTKPKNFKVGLGSRAVFSVWILKPKFSNKPLLAVQCGHIPLVNNHTKWAIWFESENTGEINSPWEWDTSSSTPFRRCLVNSCSNERPSAGLSHCLCPLHDIL